MKKISNIINAVIGWLNDSNRGKHCFLGLFLFLAIFLALSVFYVPDSASMGALLAIFGASFGMEFKDKMYGNKWDWVDIICTVAIPSVITVIILII